MQHLKYTKNCQIIVYFVEKTVFYLSCILKRNMINLSHKLRRGDEMNNWLKDLSDDTFISDINLAGTHNSCAYFVNFRYITQCQSKPIKEQLNMGIHFLDIIVIAVLKFCIFEMECG